MEHQNLTRLASDTQDRAEYFGSGLKDQNQALARVRQYVPDGKIEVLCTITDAELSEYGVPEGRTEMIRFDEAAMRQRHPGRMLA